MAAPAAETARPFADIGSGDTAAALSRRVHTYSVFGFVVGALLGRH